MNKKIQLLAMALVLSASTFAQVGIGTTSPDASSALDITATDKGFLMPRMTTALRTAIASPAMGLQVYDTETKSVWTNDGTVWKEGVGGAGKFVEGGAADIAYYGGRVGIGDTNNFGQSHKLYVKATVNVDTQTNTPGKFLGIYEGTGTHKATYGLAAESINNSTATVDFGIAIRPIVFNNKATGTINTAVASWPEVDNTGSVGYAAGVVGRVNNKGTINSADGVASDVTNAAGKQINLSSAGKFSFLNNGTINFATGVYIKYDGTGVANNAYGIYIDPSFNKGVNENYAIYSDSDADVYFKGNFGAGITTPQRKVHISGAMRLEPQAAAPAGGVLGDLYVNTDGKLYFHNGTDWKEVQLVP